MIKHQARKRFGQNFLQDDLIIHRIVQAIGPQPHQNMVEIGPGLGALTRPLLALSSHLRAIEIDKNLYPGLQQLAASVDARLELVEADALTVDFSQWGDNLRIVGNLPYNIATPLLFHVLSYHSYIADMHVMLQKEVAQRIVAQPGCKDYGRLSIMMQYQCMVEELLDVPPEAFYPKPKVNSAVIRLIPYRQSPYQPVRIEALKQVVTVGFGMRRKVLSNNFHRLVSAQDWSILGIDPSKRPEQITIEEYVHLTHYLEKLGKLS